MANDFDFIGFTYNGKHSYNDFGIYRTSDGSRYNDILIPQLSDKTIDVPGREGQYFFNSQHKTKQFNLSIAFDSLTEQQYQEMRKWLDGKNIHDLIFDETPYKVYSAKVTGSPQLKTVCFNQNGIRIYKGEGNIQFTCYYPYAHTPIMSNKTVTQLTVSKGIEVDCGLILFPGSQMQSSEGTHTIYITNLNTGKGESISFINSANDPQDKDHPLFRDYPIIINKIKRTDNNLGKLVIGLTEFYYTNNKCFETLSENQDGRNINSYNITDYPTKSEWAIASNLKFVQNGDNFGDLPAPFKVSKTGTIAEGTPLQVGTNTITLTNAVTNLEWDSKTGLVTGVVDGKRVPVPYTGTSYGALPVGDHEQESNKIILPAGSSLDYQFWYY